MATYRNRIVLRVIQYRRRYAQRRMLRDLNWQSGWERAAKCAGISRAEFYDLTGGGK